MSTKSVIRDGLQTAQMVGLAYLSDLDDAQLMLRPHPDCHSINWQIGHLIISEHDQINKIASAAMPDLPVGFRESFAATNSAADDTDGSFGKEQLLAIYQGQRQATLKVLSQLTEEQLDQPTGISYAPTQAALIQMQGAHWLMHCGQWAVVRRQCGKPVVI
ncbi:MAG: DinB family protein [Pirellulaceae bacterium]|nr:DinB family protein [Pirellulaceae bacterium]